MLPTTYIYISILGFDYFSLASLQLLFCFVLSSGMLPGFISGHYTYDQCHINLAKLASYSKANLIHTEASSLDIENQKIILKDHPPIYYDLLSINSGITPDIDSVPGVKQFATSVKPINKFVEKLEIILDKFTKSLETNTSANKVIKVVVVGGGPGGVEVALAVKHRLILML